MKIISYGNFKFRHVQYQLRYNTDLWGEKNTGDFSTLQMSAAGFNELLKIFYWY